ncbi:MAG: flagellar biosynthesis protein FliQ [Planctomycetota bacterium]
MVDESSVELVRQALIVTLKLTAPILAAGMLIGLGISLIQAITSVQDQTVSFVPKIVAMVVVMILLASWILQRLVDYSTELFRLAERAVG